MKITIQKQMSGFALPVVLLLSIVILTIITALLAAASTNLSGQYVTHYQKLADEAAEAGTAYATACLTVSPNHAQTWGPAVGKPNLGPTTDCSGATTYPSNQYAYSDTTVRTYFTVGDLDYSETFGAQVSSQGFAEILNSSGTVVKTYTSTLKKVYTWPTDTAAQMSTSGTRRTCAIVNHQVYCWGANGYGQLGNGKYVGSPQDIEGVSPVDSLVPVKVRQDPGVMAGKTIVKIFVAQFHSCALSSDGKMYCWGYNAQGQLGDGTRTDSPVPVQVGGALASKTITDIGGTNNLSCAIASSKIYCWGNDSNGMGGHNKTSGYTANPTLVTASNTSTTLPTNYTATALSTSGSRSNLMCAIAGGKAYCWGQNTIGSVGDNTTTNRSVPTKVIDTGVLSGKTVTAISQDGYISDATGGLPHVCVIASGAVYCWGENNAGQLGNNSTTDSRVPVAVVSSGVLSGKTIQDIKVGLNHSCALADNGVYCWGENGNGQVGDNNSTDRRTPVAATQSAGALTASNVVTLGAGSNRGCATITDGRTFCWGYNADGQIGDGTKITRRVPTESLFLRPAGNQYIF